MDRSDPGRPSHEPSADQGGQQLGLLFLLGSIGRTLKNLPHRVRTEIGKEHQRKGGVGDLGGDMVAEEVTCLMEDDVVLMKGARLLLIEDHIGIASGDPKPTGTHPAGDWS
jgi:hypothetical protein